MVKDLDLDLARASFYTESELQKLSADASEGGKSIKQKFMSLFNKNIHKIFVVNAVKQRSNAYCLAISRKGLTLKKGKADDQTVMEYDYKTQKVNLDGEPMATTFNQTFFNQINKISKDMEQNKAYSLIESKEKKKTN
jgi:hypothetical protein